MTQSESHLSPACEATYTHTHTHTFEHTQRLKGVLKQRLQLFPALHFVEVIYQISEKFPGTFKEVPLDTQTCTASEWCGVCYSLMQLSNSVTHV